MPLPLIMLVGKAGVGKDTAANIMAKKYNATVIAQADPIKRFALNYLGFTEDQLWGPSSSRNAPDPRSLAEIAAQYYAAEGKDLWLEDIGLPGKEAALDIWFAEFVIKDIQNRGYTTPRFVLQTLGTEFGRTLKNDVWVSYAQERAIEAVGNNRGYDKTQGLTYKTTGDHARLAQMAVISDGRFPNEIIATKRNNGVVIRLTGPGEHSLSGAAGQHPSEMEMDKIPEAWYDATVLNPKTSFDELEARLHATLVMLRVVKL